MEEIPGEITRLLLRARQGDLEAATALMPLMYHELRQNVGDRLRQGETLRPAALIEDAYLRLVDQSSVDWRDRAHFFGVASRMIRRALVDYARARLSGKRGNGKTVIGLELISVVDRPEELQQVIVVDEALEHLAAFDPQQAQVVEMHYFGGMDITETAAALGVPRRTAARDWTQAKAWLEGEMSLQAAG